MKPRIQINENQLLTVNDVAHLIGSPPVRKKVSQLEINYSETKEIRYLVFDAMEIISIIKNAVPNIEVQSIGGAHTVAKLNGRHRKAPAILVFFVWMLLFVGSGLAIMNFHEDVSMAEVHQKIYYLFTGTKNEYPLLLQIPYSLGLGLGMILFFNHLFHKKFNEEPSPLEVEVFKYEQDLEHFIVDQELRDERDR